MNRDEMVVRLAEVEVEVARAVGLDLSSTSAVQALRMHLSRLAQTEPVIEAKVSVHGAPFQALLVGLGERYGVPVYRRPRQRGTTLMLQGPRTFVHEVMGALLQQMSDALDAWFLDQTQDCLRGLGEMERR